MILENVSVGILTCDQSTTYDDTIKSLKSQLHQPKDTIIIQNVYPVSKAILQLFSKVKTSYLVILDDDMIFMYEDALLQMLNEIEKTQMFEIIYRLEDPIFGKIKGIRIYNISHIRSLMAKIQIRRDWDVDINSELSKMEKTVSLDFVIAKHHKKWSNLDLYWKMFTVAQKMDIRNLKEKRSILKKQTTCLCEIKDNTDLILYGFCGLIDGMRDNKKETFLSYKKKFHNKKFEEFQEIIE